MQYVAITKDNLEHSGVKGMKWGHRKQQYSAVELSSRQKKKASRDYKKAMVKVEQSMYDHNADLTVKAYNKTAKEYNGHKIDDFNKKHDPKDKDYDESYQEQFNKDIHKNLDKIRLDHITNNPNYIKAQELVKKYDMTKYDDLVKDNQDFMDTITQQIKSDN